MRHSNMAHFDYEVGKHLVKDAKGFWEGFGGLLGWVAVRRDRGAIGEQEVFYCIFGS